LWTGNEITAALGEVVHLHQPCLTMIDHVGNIGAVVYPEYKAGNTINQIKMVRTRLIHKID